MVVAYVVVFIMVVILMALYSDKLQVLTNSVKGSTPVRSLDTIVGRYRYMMEENFEDGTSRPDPSCIYDEYPQGDRCIFKDYMLYNTPGSVRCRHPSDTAGTYSYNVNLFKSKVDYTPKTFKEWLSALWSRNGGGFERDAVTEYVNHCQNAKGMSHILNPSRCPEPYTLDGNTLGRCAVDSANATREEAQKVCADKMNAFPNSITTKFTPSSEQNRNHVCELTLKCPKGYNSPTGKNNDEQYSNVCTADNASMTEANAKAECANIKGYYMPNKENKHMCRVLF